MVLPSLPPSLKDYKRPFNIWCKLFGCKNESKLMRHYLWGVGILTTCKRCGESFFTQKFVDMFK